MGSGSRDEKAGVGGEESEALLGPSPSSSELLVGGRKGAALAAPPPAPEVSSPRRAMLW